MIQRTIGLCIIALGLLSMLLAGCTAQYKSHCTVNVAVTLDEPNDADAECKTWPDLTDDEGNPITYKDRVLGCADQDAKKVIVQDRDSVIAHEIRHIWEWFCRRKS